jgi:hypothetical protein
MLISMQRHSHILIATLVTLKTWGNICWTDRCPIGESIQRVMHAMHNVQDALLQNDPHLLFGLEQQSKVDSNTERA